MGHKNEKMDGFVCGSFSWVRRGGGGNEDPQSDTIDDGTVEPQGNQLEDTEAPSTPSNIKATAISSSEIQLEWDAASDNTQVSAYLIYRDGEKLTKNKFYSKSQQVHVSESGSVETNKGFGVSNGKTTKLSGTETIYRDTDLAPNKHYCYQVMAVDSAGNESLLSSVSCATTNPPDSSSVCGSEIPLVISKLSLPETVKPGDRPQGSVEFKGDFQSIKNPRMYAFYPTSGNIGIVTYLINIKPSVSGCNMSFFIPVPEELSGKRTVKIRFVDNDSSIGLADNWNNNGVSNVLEKPIQIDAEEEQEQEEEEEEEEEGSSVTETNVRGVKFNLLSFGKDFFGNLTVKMRVTNEFKLTDIEFVSCDVHALRGSTIIDTAFVFFAGSGTIRRGESAEDEGTFFELESINDFDTTRQDCDYFIVG